MSKLNIADFDWCVQIGPEPQGDNFGYVNSNAAQFYLELGDGDPDATYAWYSTDGSDPSMAIPNNEIKKVSGLNIVAWRFSVPADKEVDFKFLMGPS